MPAMADEVLAKSLAAAGNSSEKLTLPSLQSKMKRDPEGYESELLLLHRHFESSLHLFLHHSALSSGAGGVGHDPAIAKDVGDLAVFLAHATPFYPARLSGFPGRLAELLRSAARSLPSSLRAQVGRALILLSNRQMVDFGEILSLFMELQTLGDHELRKLAFEHVVHCIRRMNQKHKNEAANRKLQNILFALLQEDDELKAKRSLVVLCDLHRRRVWFDDRTANAICTSCFHSSSKILVAALKFLLGYEQIDDHDSEDSSSDEEMTTRKTQAILSRETIYKAHHKGTLASKKKKQAKLQRAIRSMKKQQRLSSEKTNPNYYSPLTHLKDAQGFAEKLFSRFQSCNERFEVKLMMLKVIARTIGLHQLVLLNFYPLLQKYCEPHQRDVTSILAAAVQACHDMVPPDAVEPLFKKVVNQFIHDGSRSEAIVVGLNFVREICLRIPLLMTQDLLQDLVLYKKSHEKAESSAARSLITLFREVCPSLLVKKDRGRPSNPRARPKAFGEKDIATDVPDVELLQFQDEFGSSDEENAFDMDYANEDGEDVDGGEEDGDQEEGENTDDEDVEGHVDDFGTNYELEVCDDDLDTDHSDDDDDDEEESEDEEVEVREEDNREGDDREDVEEEAVDEIDGRNDDEAMEETLNRKRKLPDQSDNLNALDASLRALKRLAAEKMGYISTEPPDGLLSNEDFKRIKELKAKKETKLALAQHGLLRKGSESKSSAIKIPSSAQLSLKRVDPSKLEANIRSKLSKHERLALVRAGREDRGKYLARAAVKQKKTGGLSNRQKEHKKAMPLAAKRAKVARTRENKKRKQKRSGKQFSGKKAWK